MEYEYAMKFNSIVSDRRSSVYELKKWIMLFLFGKPIKH